MGTERYFAAESPEAMEAQRLGYLEAVFDPETTARMEALGVGPGWACLEVGAGGGSIARWLADRVGPGGRVVAADLDLRMLERLGDPRLEIRRHDVNAQEFEPGAYDLVHCRALLLHVRDPEEALARMSRAVRPGGWLFVEEPDYRSFGAVDPNYPGALEFDRSMQAMREFTEAAGMMRSYFGRRLPGMVESLGFEQAGFRGTVSLTRGEQPLARFHSSTTQVAGPRELFTRVGVQTHEQLDHVIRMCDDPAFAFVGPTLFGAWARRPARHDRHAGAAAR